MRGKRLTIGTNWKEKEPNCWEIIKKIGGCSIAEKGVI